MNEIQEKAVRLLMSDELDEMIRITDAINREEIRLENLKKGFEEAKNRLIALGEAVVVIQMIRDEVDLSQVFVTVESPFGRL